jgi:hypothetical protein
MEPSARPKAVSVLGWVFLVVSGLFFLRSALNLVAFEMLRWQAPELFDRVNVLARPWVPEFLLRHTGAVYLAQMAIAVAAALLAWGFLALKPWARRCLQALSWLLLALDAGFAAFWAKLWAGRGGEPGKFPPMSTHFGKLLYGGLLIFAVWAAVLGVVLFLLQSTAVRAAFERRSSEVGSPEVASSKKA